MIEDSQQIVPVEQKFLVVLDSKIPSTLSSTNISNKSDLYFDLQTPIIKSVDDLQLRCSVVSGVFPNSFYTINNKNSYLSFTLFYGTTLDVTSNISITIPEGNYSAYAFVNTLESLINTDYHSAGFISVNFDVVLITNSNSLQFTLTDSLHIYTGFRISFQPSNIGTNTAVSQLGDVIGFQNDYDYYSGPVVTAFNTNAKFSNTTGIIYAPYPINLSGLRAFNIILKNYNTSSIPIQTNNSQIGWKSSIKNSNYNNPNINNIKNNVICNVSVNSNPYEYIFYDKQNEFSIDIKETVLSRIHILIVDNLGNLVDFNNQDWSLTLEFCLVKNIQVKTRSFYEILQTGRF